MYIILSKMPLTLYRYSVSHDCNYIVPEVLSRSEGDERNFTVKKKDKQ